MRFFHIWAASMRVLKPKFIVHECGPNWMCDIFKWWFEDMYTIRGMHHPGPILMGWPQRRPRSYAWAALRESFIFVGSAEDYTRRVQASLQLDGDCYFSGDPADAQSEFAQLLGRRAFSPALATEAMSIDWRDFYSPGAQRRIREHDAMRERRQ
eukprot:5055343-Alexandrium_andersonii.AAC.1